MERKGMRKLPERNRKSSAEKTGDGERELREMLNGLL